MIGGDVTVPIFELVVNTVVILLLLRLLFDLNTVKSNIKDSKLSNIPPPD